MPRKNKRGNDGMQWRIKHGFCMNPGCGNASAVGSLTCMPPSRNGDDLCYEDIYTPYEAYVSNWEREGHTPMGGGDGE